MTKQITQGFDDPEDIDHFMNTFLNVENGPRPLPPIVAFLGIVGNEDCPLEIHLFAVNDYREMPTVYTLDPSGIYIYARGPLPQDPALGSNSTKA